MLQLAEELVDDFDAFSLRLNRLLAAKAVEYAERFGPDYDYEDEIRGLEIDTIAFPDDVSGWLTFAQGEAWSPLALLHRREPARRLRLRQLTPGARSACRAGGVSRRALLHRSRRKPLFSGQHACIYETCLL